MRYSERWNIVSQETTTLIYDQSLQENHNHNHEFYTHTFPRNWVRLFLGKGFFVCFVLFVCFLTIISPRAQNNSIQQNGYIFDNQQINEECPITNRLPLNRALKQKEASQNTSKILRISALKFRPLLPHTGLNGRMETQGSFLTLELDNSSICSANIYCTPSMC